MSFNGEIYNHNELRHELEEAGIQFRTSSNTEVIASSLVVWGVAALQRFIGMFVFVALDTATGEFPAALDPMGVKPLYLIRQDNSYLLCSEIRPLLNATGSGEVMLLPPGYVMSNSAMAAYPSRLGLIAAPPAEGDRYQLDALLEEAVRVRLPPDLPVASMFSGGIDGTLITLYARKFDDRIPGYFLGGSAAPDYEYAARYAEMTKLDFRMVEFPSSDDTFALMPEIVSCTEAFEPEIIRGATCSYLLAEQVHADGYRVALCGEGADELFCGYLPLEPGHILIN